MSYAPLPCQIAAFPPASYIPPTSGPMSNHSIPTAAREHYENIFVNEACGKPYLNGAEAATLYMGSGPSRADLSRIWEDSDRNHDGRLEKEEFVQAMWKINLQAERLQANTTLQRDQSMPLGYQPSPMHPLQQYQPNHLSYDATTNNAPPVQTRRPYGSNSPQPIQKGQPSDPNQRGMPKVELLTAIRCKGCLIGLAPSDIVYHSSNEYFCTACPHPPNFTQATLIVGKGLPTHSPSLLDGCSGCWKDIKKGGMMWRCKKCWDDKSLCEKCWKKSKKHCKHVASGQVILMRVVDGQDDDDDDDNSSSNNNNNNNDDDDGLEDLIDGIVSIVS
ncbi:cytoskeletal-regulatory complex EF hand domain-containing protein [Fusarium austroafricanum]|uniref:Cytoskeletal-regulatory complex EF hand domain-containing protein n=1 Tax=Fusarium austroafricanum TaxID=2364996 RepID=A0A8H4JVL9_9HYPO|nr:cytoskeletal-regulatory complex EF hand domain-containing protein [Fusarium austroafricanum]